MSATIFSDDYETDKIAAYYEVNAGGTWDRNSGVAHGGSFALRSIKAAGTSNQTRWLRIGACPPAVSWPVFPSDADQIAAGIDYTSKFQDVTVTVWHRIEPGWVQANGDCKFIRMSSFAGSAGEQACVLHMWTDDADPTGLMLDPATTIAGAGSGANLADTVVTATTWNDFAHLDFFGAGRSTSKPQSDAFEGLWTRLDVRMKLNTIGVADGAAELWINGVREVNLTGLNWRSSYSTYGINTIHLEHYWNNLAAAGNTSYFDDFQVVDNTASGTPAIIVPRSPMQIWNYSRR